MLTVVLAVVVVAAAADAASPMKEGAIQALMTLEDLHVRPLAKPIQKLQRHVKDVESRSVGTAVLVEPRKHPMLSAIVKNMYWNLPTTWKLQLFHTTNNDEYINEDPFLASLVKSGALKLYNIETASATKALWRNLQKRKRAFNKLMTSTILWAQIATEKILIFHLDSVLCSGSDHRIDDFVAFDFVGAPVPKVYWQSNNQPSANGGLSLRSKSTMIATIREFVEKNEVRQYRKGRLKGISTVVAEDMFYCKVLHAP
jgi:hypothetical protein